MKTSVRLFCLLALMVLPAWAADPADFSGAWSTTYGLLTLKQTGTRVAGSYSMQNTPCWVEGTVQGQRLDFTYREPNTAGTGWFELTTDGVSFDGRWREDGDARWSRWTGERAKDTPGETAAPFAGIWNSSFGPIRLNQSGNTVRGFYRMPDGRFAEVVGTAKDNVLDFSYDECGTKGTGRFTLASDDDEFTGTWQADGTTIGTGTTYTLTEAEVGKVITIIELRPLEPKSTLALVEVRGREYLLGVSAHSINLLADLSEQPAPPPRPADFSSLLAEQS